MTPAEVATSCQVYRIIVWNVENYCDVFTESTYMRLYARRYLKVWKPHLAPFGASSELADEMLPSFNECTTSHGFQRNVLMRVNNPFHLAFKSPYAWQVKTDFEGGLSLLICSRQTWNCKGIVGHQQLVPPLVSCDHCVFFWGKCCSFANHCWSKVLQLAACRVFLNISSIKFVYNPQIPTAGLKDIWKHTR